MMAPALRPTDVAATALIDIRLLGAPAILAPAWEISPAKPFVFAAALYLGVNRGRVVRREELAAILWPDASDAKRSERTRWLVRQLKLAGFPARDGVQELGLTAADVRIDVETLSLESSAMEALGRIGGGVLSGYDPLVSDRYAHWLEETRDAYRADVMRVLGAWLVTLRRSR